MMRVYVEDELIAAKGFGARRAVCGFGRLESATLGG